MAHSTKPIKNKPPRQYNLVLQDELFVELKKVAAQNGISMVELLRRFIRLGLLVEKLQNEPDSAFLIREGNSEREVILI